MTTFVKKIIAMTITAIVLLQSSAVFAVPDGFVSDDILAKSAKSRFGVKMNTDESDNSAHVLEGCIIGIDPGHQLKADSEQEQVYPDNTELTKDRMSPGGFGVCSGAAEYEINLDISLRLAALLRAAGAKVVMTRSSNNVSISNMERAQLMNESGVDFWIRVHCNSSNFQRTNGALVIAPAKDMEIHPHSAMLAQHVLAEFCEATGAANKGVSYTSTQTGFNWSIVPVITIEMGYLTNPREDVLLCREFYRSRCAEGIFAGIAAYCAEEDEA